jgi:hypothetical protein
VRRLPDLRADLPVHIPIIGPEGYAVIDAGRMPWLRLLRGRVPGKGHQLKHFTDQQLIAKTAALFTECVSA